jgi:aspartate carbamoyltransferase catalytic subunit
MANEAWWGSHEGVDFPHVVFSQQFSRENLDKIFELAMLLKLYVPKRKRVDWLAGCNCANLFYEPSTRTRGSFETAENRLGAVKVSSENASEFSSAVKGESLGDTGSTWAQMADVIVMRHKIEGAAKTVALRVNREENPPAVINGGDGKGQHPTQALLDLYTMYERFGRVDQLKVVMAGDLENGRTVRSGAFLLAKYDGVEITFVSSPFSRMRQDIKDHLTEHGVKWSETDDLLEAAKWADAVYMTRPQLERVWNPLKRWLMRRANAKLMMTLSIAEQMSGDSIIMHPLPRNVEIPEEVDANERAWYFLQVENGVYIRMALLLIIFNPRKATELLSLEN